MSLCYNYRRPDGSCMRDCPGRRNVRRCHIAREQKLRDIRHNKTIKFFKVEGINFTEYSSGLFLVQDEFIFSPKSYKWRKSGSNEWHECKDAPDFYFNVLKKIKIPLDSKLFIW